MKTKDLLAGDLIYDHNFGHYGTITSISADSVDTIVDYIDDSGEAHKVYAYMIEKCYGKSK